VAGGPSRYSGQTSDEWEISFGRVARLRRTEHPSIDASNAIPEKHNDSDDDQHPEQESFALIIHTEKLAQRSVTNLCNQWRELENGRQAHKTKAEPSR